MKIIFLYIMSFLLLNAQSSRYDMGKELYIKNGCHTCHGMKLEGLHQYPYLANRAKGYMEYKLKRFRSRLSDNQQQEMMIPFAIGLSDDDIENLSIYMNEFVEEENKKRYDDSYQVHGDGGS